jgi:predicted dithiol-disulfide oxidoreductase (DUF899 family)
VDEHEVVPHDEWLDARKQLLAEEKEFTRARDRMTRRLRDLPWEEIDKRSQLLVYHFMFDPADDVGCPICSFWADNFEPVVLHLRARDVTFVAVSLAPFAKIAAYKARMDWTFPWFSSFGSDFNFDYGVSFRPEQGDEPVYNYGTLPPRDTQREGVSVFARDDDGRIFHTYSAYARGIDLVNTAYNYLDLVPKGRDEDGRGPYWVRRHDEY